MTCRLICVLVVVVSTAEAFDKPFVELVERTVVFTESPDVQSDTRLTFGWPRLSLARGLDLGLRGYGRWDTANTTDLTFDEFRREEREPALSVDELSLTFDLARLWPVSEQLLGGAVEVQVGKFFFPMFGVGDVVRLSDVFVPHNFAHNPVVRDPADPTADERLSQYGISLSWERQLSASHVRLECLWAPVFVPNLYASRGPWRIVPTGAVVDNDLPAIRNSQQFSGRGCIASHDYGVEMCFMGYAGYDQIPFVVPSSATAVRLVYGQLRQYGASFSVPLPFADDIIGRFEVAYANYRPNVGTDAVSISTTLESARVLLDRELFVLLQGMWRNVGQRSQPFHEVLYRGALGRVRYGSLLDRRDWAVQFEAGVNANPVGFILQPALFLPTPPFLDGFWKALGVAAPRVEMRYVLFGGESEHVFGGAYRQRDHVMFAVKLNL